MHCPRKIYLRHVIKSIRQIINNFFLLNWGKLGAFEVFKLSLKLLNNSFLSTLLLLLLFFILAYKNETVKSFKDEKSVALLSLLQFEKIYFFRV